MRDIQVKSGIFANDDDSYDTSLHHLQVIKVVLSSRIKIEGKPRKAGN